AAEAEQRVANALEQAEKIRRDADAHAKDLVSNARRNADRVVAEAREHAERTLSEAMTEAERERTSAQRQVEDLNRQRESITSYLDELRNLLGHEPMPSRQILERADDVKARFEAAAPAAAVAAVPTPSPAPDDAPREDRTPQPDEESAEV